MTVAPRISGMRMGLFDRLRFFGTARPAPPILIRVRAADGSVPETVTIETRWLPSDARDTKTAWTAQGLCIVPWRSNARSVEIVLRAAGGVARVRAAADEYDGEAEAVVLTPERG